MISGCDAMTDSATGPRRVVHINSASGWAGGEVHVFLLCQQLAARGHEVVLICRPGSAIDAKFRANSLPVYNLPLRNAADLFSAWQIAAFCEKRQADILHAHLGRDYWLAALAKLFRTGPRIVFSRHLLFAPKGGSIHRWLYAQADKVIAVSAAVARVLLASGIVVADKLVTIYNGINTERFSSTRPGLVREELHIAPATAIVGMVGHVSPHKGQETFVLAMPAILARHPDTAFLVVGDDFREGEYIRQLKRLAEGLGVGNKVFFLGPREDIPEIMKDLTVFVSASKTESFGLVVAEAMAAGKPVAAAAVGGVKELVVTGETGLLFPPEDHEALAAAVAELLGDRELARRLGASGAVRAKENFSVATMTDKTLDVYSDLERAAGRGAKGPAGR